jgi:hypothetical protein
MSMMIVEQRLFHNFMETHARHIDLQTSPIHMSYAKLMGITDVMGITDEAIDVKPFKTCQP